MTRIKTAASALVAAMLLIGCQSKSTEAPAMTPSNEPAAASSQPARVAGLDAGWQLASHATYTAQQTGDTVTITAKGESSTAGYQVKLVESMLRIWPPQHMLAMKKPDGMVAQVITPFEVSKSFKSTDPLKTIVVTDAEGRHEVEVTH